MTEINLRRQLTPFEWLQFPPEIKILFKETFKIPKTGGSIVVADKVISDGHTNEDLSIVSLKTLQEYLGTDDDHWDNLLKLTINRMENANDEELDPQLADTSESTRIEQGTVSPKRHYKKAKKAV